MWKVSKLFLVFWLLIELLKQKIKKKQKKKKTIKRKVAYCYDDLTVLEGPICLVLICDLGGDPWYVFGLTKLAKGRERITSLAWHGTRSLLDF